MADSARKLSMRDTYTIWESTTPEMPRIPHISRHQYACTASFRHTGDLQQPRKERSSAERNTLTTDLITALQTHGQLHKGTDLGGVLQWAILHIQNQAEAIEELRETATGKPKKDKKPHEKNN